MSDEIARRPGPASVVESVVLQGDLSKISPEERLSYYTAVCESLGLNPLTRPFEYITLNGKLTLYAKRDCTDQLRNLRNVSVRLVDKDTSDGVFSVTAQATMPNGRTDESTGAVSIANLRGDALANAKMKAETKAKRRVTLSICGLGLLDETEMETIPHSAQAHPVVTELPAKPQETSQPRAQVMTKADPKPATEMPITEEQIEIINRLKRALKYGSDEHRTDGLTKAEAAELISTLSQEWNESKGKSTQGTLA